MFLRIQLTTSLYLPFRPRPLPATGLFPWRHMVQLGYNEMIKFRPFSCNFQIEACEIKIWFKTSERHQFSIPDTCMYYRACICQLWTWFGGVGVHQLTTAEQGENLVCLYIELSVKHVDDEYQGSKIIDVKITYMGHCEVVKSCHSGNVKVIRSTCT